MKKRRKLLTVLSVTAIVIIVTFIYLALSGGKLHRQYKDDVQLSFNEAAGQQQNTAFTDEAIAGLPLPMQKYLSHCGYVGKPIMDYMYLDCIEAKFAMSQDQSPIQIHYEQYNFAARPDRHAFVDAKMFGMHIINGKDTLMNGGGSMTIRLAKLFEVGNSSGHEMSQSQLITALADAVWMPSLYLQDYVTWTPIDETHAECTITWGDLTASGTFTFNEAGEIIQFDTNDRYQDNNGESINLPWTVEYGSYHDVDGFRRSGAVKIYWHMPDGSRFTYFECDNYTVSYSVN